MFPRWLRFAAVPAVAAIFVAGVAVGFALSPAPPSPSARPAEATPREPATVGVGVADVTPRYPVAVIRVIDGDTFEARVQVWPAIEIATKVRLRDIDAPEMRGRCGEELAMAQAAREALVTMLADAPVTIARVGTDKYGGRMLADASTGGVSDVASALLAAGLVRRYSGGRREPWCRGASTSG